MPESKLGKWAGALLVVFLVSLLALIIFLNVLDFRRGSAALLVPGTLMMMAGVAAFIAGVISLFKYKDRSFLVIAAAIFGFFAVLMFVMEIVEAIQ
jgi:hypothetical protein